MLFSDSDTTTATTSAQRDISPESLETQPYANKFGDNVLYADEILPFADSNFPDGKTFSPLYWQMNADGETMSPVVSISELRRLTRQYDSKDIELLLEGSGESVRIRRIGYGTVVLHSLGNSLVSPVRHKARHENIFNLEPLTEIGIGFELA